MDTSKTRLTLRDDDLIEKVELLDWDNDEVIGYTVLNYDNNALITSIDCYDIEADEAKKSTSTEALFMSINMSYTDYLLTSMSADLYDEEGSLEETVEVGKIVYDDAGNPVEVWSSLIDYDNNEGVNFVVDENGKISIEPREYELMKIVEIEYNYTLPNFFGKTLEYLIPELQGLKINNAPVRITQSGSFNFAQMEYFDFNEGGYPAKVKLDANMQDTYRKSTVVSRSPIPMGTELQLEYKLME
jgi:hypothetical protein